MKNFLSLLCCLSFLSVTLHAQQSDSMQHITIYKEKERFAGWPANYGIWSWGKEIVTGFYLGYHDDTKLTGHPIKKDKPQQITQARSVDGGLTWKIEKPSFLDADYKEKKPVELKEPINFNHPDFAFLVRFEGAQKGYSHFYYSYDRCKTWQGPFQLPSFDRKGIFGRTDYIINSKHEMHAFFTGAKDNGGEGWCMSTKTTDGGRTWQFEGWMGPQPDDSSFSIMSSTVRLKNNSLLSVLRGKGMDANQQKKFWLDAYLSPNEGKSWYKLNEPFIENGGNPAHLVKLSDGRLVLTYGTREKPYGIRARVSADDGLTWGSEIVLRDDGHVWDLGYVRTAVRDDDKLVTVYYFNVAESKERFIAATIWDAGNTLK